MTHFNDIMISNLFLVVLIINILFGFKRTNRLYCGLVGYSGSVDLNTLKIKLLMLYNQERGSDSSGFYMWDHEKKIELKDRHYREIGKTSTNLLPKYSPSGGHLFIGHTRSGTMGGKTVDCAHPFVFPSTETQKPIIGAHNGIVSNNLALLDRINETITTTPVDSMTLIKLLRHEESYIKALSMLGSNNNALLFTRDDGTLFAFRMEGRPLFFGYTMEEAKVTGMYISSIKDSLNAIECVNIAEFEKDYMYTIQDGIIFTRSYVKNEPYYKYRESSRVSDSNRTSRVGASSSTIIDADYEEEIMVEFTQCSYYGDKVTFKDVRKKIFEEAKLAKIHNIVDVVETETIEDTDGLSSDTEPSEYPFIGPPEPSSSQSVLDFDMDNEFSNKKMTEERKSEIVLYMVELSNTLSYISMDLNGANKSNDYAQVEACIKKIEKLKSNIRVNSVNIQNNEEHESLKEE